MSATRPGEGQEDPTRTIGRFAPSTTGPAHPGTLLAALLCWLDARSRGGRVWLRLEDLDPERCRPAFADGMRRDLAWLGLDWDGETLQSEGRDAHEDALDRLAAAERLYPCACSRAALRADAERAPDGSARYPGTCRARPLPPGGWRASAEPLRARLPEGRIAVEDEGGVALDQDPVAVMGDPVVRRRDGAIAYHLAGVVDDDRIGVTRVVRGRDLALSTATQVALQRLLGLATPAYRHHLLLREDRKGKLAKLHRSVSLEALRPHHDGPGLVGLFAAAVGLRERPVPVTPAELTRDFAWERVTTRDRVARVSPSGLVLSER